MHCNRDEWWSKLAMAAAWGQYINGIAVYGRDPIFACSHAYFSIRGNGCNVMDPEANPFNHTYYLCIAEASSGTNTSMSIFWRQCFGPHY